MKKVILISILYMFTFFEYSLAQEKCGTIASPPPEWIFKPLTRSIPQTTEGYIIKIFVHLIQNNSGQGAGVELVQQCQKTLNRFYAQMHIQFEVIGYEIIYNNDYYLRLRNNEELALSKINNHSNSIDIFVLPDFCIWDKGGNAFTIPSKILIIKEIGTYNTTIAHEIGHCLGLYHTHHGTMIETGLVDY